MKRSKQERELTDEERNLVVAVRHCSGELNDILQGCRRKAQSNAQLFAQSGISIMFRGLESYADMYEKLQVKSREGLDRLFTKFADCEEVQDAQDAIEETEGNWNDFLENLNREVSRELNGELPSNSEAKSSSDLRYFITSEYPLTDLQTNKEVTLGDYVGQYTCVFVTFQPSYWPDTCVRWRHSEIMKVKADLSLFNMGFVVVTWGPVEEVRTWSKQLSRATKWPVLWDKTNKLCSRFGFRSGLHNAWAAENLDFLGCQRAMHNRPVSLLPTDFDWLGWRQIGGEAVIARPVIWDATVVQSRVIKAASQLRLASRKRGRDSEDADKDDVGDTSGDVEDLEMRARRDKLAVSAGETKVCLLHQSNYSADLTPSGAIYQAALTCFAQANNTTESMVMDRIRQNRRFATPPESARLQYEASTGLYYDPETALYYDAARGYFYDGTNQTYYYWSQSEHRYIPANTLIQAEMVAAQAAQAAAAQAAVNRAAAEREAARKAALNVAAQLAEIRASKDDYAAYVYATCVLPQQSIAVPDGYSAVGSKNALSSVYRNTSAAASNIETSLKVWDAKQPEPLVPYADDTVAPEPTRYSNTPPPPGL
ncbi:hypothetical protein X801_00250 [Opisthorchis viverrini]|uniref:Uncharacterized protein n=2 Tax=Opisthorchis viverrini TaxID=6198 RepID=A0A1S8XAT3_OPIVI|nr:hypothetical protein T265_10152 [Opisthorchis viverrini]KER21557.1 hypothetical protein T265_10152 [Opisthorchis viverrini]OON23824.1 hypothetical protein X801_00250 [Opisthorchis viverrini]